MESSATRDRSSARRRKRKTKQPKVSSSSRVLWRRIVLVLLAMLVLGLGYLTIRIGLSVNRAYQSAQALATLAGSDDPLAYSTQAQRHVTEISQSVAEVAQVIRPVSPLLERLGGVTSYGASAAAVPVLMESGVGLMNVVDKTVGILAPALEETSQGPALDRLVAALTSVAPALTELAPDAVLATEQLTAVDAATLDPAVAKRLSRVQTLAPALPFFLRLAPDLPGLLGYDGPRTYLILVQNNHELRATGGFITAIGRVSIDKGQIVDLKFSDSYQFFDPRAEYAAAPPPMQIYMKVPLLLLRDANWSPDLPTTAVLAKTLYRQQTDLVVDGVVTLDLHAVELLTAAVGPLTIEGVDQPVTGSNVVAMVKQFWDRPNAEDKEVEKTDSWWFQRKDFMPTLAGAALQRLQQGNVDPTKLVEAGMRALDRRAIQVVLNDPAARSVLHEFGWDGGLHPKIGADYLALVDTNMGYNKVDAVLSRSLSHTIAWGDGENGVPVATTTVVYRHPLDLPNHVCDNTPRYGDTYDEMAERCYFDFVRLYTPGGSRLRSVQGVDDSSVTSQRGENGTQVFSGYFVMKPGEEHTVTFTYELPAAVTSQAYSLVVQRQSGTEPLPLRVEIGPHVLDTTLVSGQLDWAP